MEEGQRLMSMHLSRVLEDIGVNKYMIARRRRTWLVVETLWTVSDPLEGFNTATYYYGSQSEGTTTFGMKSDIDTLLCYNAVPVILDYSEWKLGKNHLLAVKTEQSPPQHCWLQRVRPDLPLPETQVDITSDVVDSEGRVLRTNTQMEYHEIIREKTQLGELVQHGPSRSWDENIDNVIAYHCAHLPQECQFMFNRPRPGHWPKPETLARARTTAVFLVPQGYTESPLRPSRCRSAALSVILGDQTYPRSKWEWRFSTSMMERLLVFDMNTVQHKTYVIIKILRKTFFKPVVGDRLSTFHIKTAMLYTIETYPPEIWREERITQCVIYCLTTLIRWLKINYCPHYTIYGVNLFTGKLFKDEQIMIKNMLFKMIRNKLSCLFKIEMDKIGRRMASLHISTSLEQSRLTNHQSIISELNFRFCTELTNQVLGLIISSTDQGMIDSSCTTLISYIATLQEILEHGSNIEEEAASLIKPFLCGTLASLLSSARIQLSQPITQNIIDWFQLSFNSELLSSRLKFASMLYCSGQNEEAANCLTCCEGLLGPEVWQCCCCDGRMCNKPNREFLKRTVNSSNKDMIQNHTATCVLFTPQEMYCLPAFLVFEMFRTISEEDRQQRRPARSFRWMEWAVIDCVPFLHYLQYLTFRQLNLPHKKQAALQSLEHYVFMDSNGHGHIDTALNMLGHCNELENRLDLAWICYTVSLRIYPRNNAAKWHVARLRDNE